MGGAVATSRAGGRTGTGDALSVAEGAPEMGGTGAGRSKGCNLRADQSGRGQSLR